MTQLIGTTSWVIPGTYYENVEYITKRFSEIQFIELLVFTWDKETYKLFEKEKGYLNKIAFQKGIAYTVHLPTDSIENILNAFHYLEKSLEVANYVLHPLCDTSDKEFTKILNHPKVSFENLKERVVNHSRTVFDIGHHILGKNVDSEFLNNIIEIHMMGVEGGTDHKVLDLETLSQIYKILSNKLFTVRYICFEVFDENELETSLITWHEFKNKMWNKGVL